MSFYWPEYLTLAQELASRFAASPIQEAALRSAMSRAYYAAFCEARNHLKYIDHESIGYGAVVHAQVIEIFEDSNDRTYQKIGQLLRHTRLLRNKADYEDKLTHKYLQSGTKSVLTEAEEILRLLNTL